MNLGVLIDIAASVLAVMLLFSLATTAINEVVADNIRNLRAKTLEEGLRALLESRHLREIAERYRAEKAKGLPPGEDAGVDVSDDRRIDAASDRLLDWALGRFYADPSIRSLMRGARKPSAIEPRRYAIALIEVLGQREELEKATVETLKKREEEVTRAIAGVAEALNVHGHGAALSAHAGHAFDLAVEGVRRTGETIDEAIGRLEAEFSETMDRVSGWYVRKTKVMSFVIGLGLAFGSNIDLLGYANRLLTTADARERAAAYAELLPREEREGALAAAERAAEEEMADAVGREIATLMAGLEELSVQVGWSCLEGLDRPDDQLAPAEREEKAWAVQPPDVWLLREIRCEESPGYPFPSFSQVLGWLLIAFGMTLGAQFWFDLLKRIAGMRSAGKTGGAKS